MTKRYCDSAECVQGLFDMMVDRWLRMLKVILQPSYKDEREMDQSHSELELAKRYR